LQDLLTIGEDETAGEIHDRMKALGANLLVKTIEGLAAGTITEQPQSQVGINQNAIQHAPKIFTETCKVDFTKSVDEVHNLIRGLSPFPGAFINLGDKLFKIYHSKKEISTPQHSIGDFTTDGKTFLKFACNNGYIHVLQLQLEGKKKMDVADFLRGHKF
jgi:methionyl-tRNA formyltransferase